jgi:hypothetical protein
MDNLKFSRTPVIYNLDLTNILIQENDSLFIVHFKPFKGKSWDFIQDLVWEWHITFRKYLLVAIDLWLSRW